MTPAELAELQGALDRHEACFREVLDDLQDAESRLATLERQAARKKARRPVSGPPGHAKKITSWRRFYKRGTNRSRRG